MSQHRRIVNFYYRVTGRGRSQRWTPCVLCPSAGKVNQYSRDFCKCRFVSMGHVQDCKRVDGEPHSVSEEQGRFDNNDN